MQKKEPSKYYYVLVTTIQSFKKRWHGENHPIILECCGLLNRIIFEQRE